MPTRLEIRQILKQRGFNVTNARITKAAKALNLDDRFHYEDWEADLIYDEIAPTQTQQAETSQAPTSSELARVAEASELGILSAIQQQNQSIAGELVQAKANRDAFADRASDLLVQLATETKPLIYHLAEQKLKALEQKHDQQFSIAALAAEAFALPAMETPFLLTSSVMPH